MGRVYVFMGPAAGRYDLRHPQSGTGEPSPRQALRVICSDRPRWAGIGYAQKSELQHRQEAEKRKNELGMTAKVTYVHSCVMLLAEIRGYLNPRAGSRGLFLFPKDIRVGLMRTLQVAVRHRIEASLKRYSFISYPVGGRSTGAITRFY